MLPQDRKGALERTRSHLRLRVIEEVSMVSANLYNMLLYRSFMAVETVGKWSSRITTSLQALSVACLLSFTWVTFSSSSLLALACR